MNHIRYLFIFISLMLAINYVSAAPQITIVSPLDAVYDTTKVFLNVTSNETVTFFMKLAKNKEEMIVAENTTVLNDYLYFKQGNHKFTIWGKNNRGETNASVSFSSSHSNPVNVTSCGFLYSSNTEYVLANNISTESYECVHIVDVTNIKFNLNQNTVNAGYLRGIRINWASNIEIYNGTISGSPVNDHWYPVILDLEGTNLRFNNLNINGFMGIYTDDMQNSIFENVVVNSSIGFFFWILNDVSFVNSTFVWNGLPPSYAFQPFADHSDLVLEEFEMKNFEYDFYLEGAYSDFFFRNTHFNLSKVYYPDWSTTTRFYRQHKVIINVSDQLNKTGSGVIEIKDTISKNSSKFKEKDNPTGNLLLATDERGIAETWLTERLFVAKTSSPVVVEDVDFSDYNITAKTWAGEDTTVQLSLASNTTISVPIHISIPVALPECTIPQLLDLNNDDTINMQDAVIILRYISGLPVTSLGSKECAGISLNPF